MAQKRGYRINNEGNRMVNWAPRYPNNRSYAPVAWGAAANMNFQLYRICSVIYMNNPGGVPSVSTLPVGGVVMNVNNRFESFMYRVQNEIRSTWTSFYPGNNNITNTAATPGIMGIINNGVNFGIATQIAPNRNVAINSYPNLADPVMGAAGGDIPNPLLPNPGGPGFVSNWAAYNNYMTGGLGPGAGLIGALGANIVGGATQATGVLVVAINALRIPVLATFPGGNATIANRRNGMPNFLRRLAVGEAVGNAIVGVGRSNVFGIRAQGINSNFANNVNRRIVNLFTQVAQGGVAAIETPAHEFGHMMGLEDRYAGLGYVVNRGNATANTTPLSNIPLNNIRVGAALMPSNVTLQRWQNQGNCMVYAHNIQPNPAMYLPGPFSYRQSDSTVVSSLSFNNTGQYLPPYLVPSFSQFYDPEYSMFFGWRHNLMSRAQPVMNPLVPANFSRARFGGDVAFTLLFQGGSLFHNESISNLAQGFSPSAPGVLIPTTFITGVQLNIILDNEANKGFSNTIVIGSNNYIHDVEEFFLDTVRSIGLDSQNIDPNPPPTPGSPVGTVLPAAPIPIEYNGLITHNFTFGATRAADVFMRWTYLIGLNSLTASNLLANIPFNDNIATSAGGTGGTFVGMSLNATAIAIDSNRVVQEELNIVHDDNYVATGLIGVDDVMDYRIVGNYPSSSPSPTTSFLNGVNTYFTNIPVPTPAGTITEIENALSGLDNPNNGNLFNVNLINKHLSPTANTSVNGLTIVDAFSANRGLLQNRFNNSQIYYAPQPNILNFLAGALVRGAFPFRANLLASQLLPTQNVNGVIGQGNGSTVPSATEWSTMWSNYVNSVGIQPVVIASPIPFNDDPTIRNSGPVLNYLTRILQNLGIIDAQSRQNGISLDPTTPGANPNIISTGSTFGKFVYDFSNQSLAVQSPPLVLSHGTTLNQYFTNNSARFQAGNVNGTVIGSNAFRANIWNARELMLANSINTDPSTTVQQFSSAASAGIAPIAPLTSILNTPNNIPGGLPAGWDNELVGGRNEMVVRFFIFDNASFAGLAGLTPAQATQQARQNTNSLFGVEIRTNGVQLYRNRDLLINIS